MRGLNALARAAGNGRSALAVLCVIVAAACAVFAWERGRKPVPELVLAADRGPEAAAERYVLPITAPIDQGDSGLCWVFAAVSMLETNYMSRHPGAHVEFSRAALQRDSIDDRFRRLIRGEPGDPSDGGLAIEALDLIRKDGLIDQRDFRGVINSGPLFASLKGTLAKAAEPGQKERELDEKLDAALGPKPEVTHLEGRPVTPAALASAALDGETWTEFDLSRDGAEGWGPSRDPEARAGSRVRYVGLATLIDLLHKSLARGEAAVVGTVDHAMLVYGADYDRAGRPISYLVKDSFAPYLYRADANDLNSELNDVTVALDVVPRDLAINRPVSDPRIGVP